MIRQLLKPPLKIDNGTVDNCVKELHFKNAFGIRDSFITSFIVEELTPPRPSNALGFENSFNIKLPCKFLCIGDSIFKATLAELFDPSLFFSRTSIAIPRCMSLFCSNSLTVLIRKRMSYQKSQSELIRDSASLFVCGSFVDSTTLRRVS